jgi:GDSL/SGNH-like Acyl-Esterase family found in Pmr5 and Cas1p
MYHCGTKRCFLLLISVACIYTSFLFIQNNLIVNHTLRLLSNERWFPHTNTYTHKHLNSSSPSHDIHGSPSDSLPYVFHNDSASLLPLCRREQIYPGKWRSVNLDQPPYISKTLHLRCQIEGYDYDNPGPWPSWEWEPRDSSCQLSPWNATALCNLVPFATLSMIGDSLSWEQYSSLIQLLGRRVHQTDQHASRLEERNVVYTACKDENRVTKFVFRNDAELKAQTIVHSIEHDFPMILILNRGAHYVADSELLDDMQELLPVLLQWQTKCRNSFQTKCHLFWRTTVPGHTKCEEFNSPVNDLADMESWIQSKDNYDNETIWNFHWQDYQRQNLLVLQTFQEFSLATGLQYEVLDAYELNVLRPDGHRWHQNDCLHNCYPGKMDVYNQLLLHFLKMQRSTEDAQQLIDRFELFLSSQLNSSGR